MTTNDISAKLAIKPRTVQVTALGDGRFSLELPLTTPPEQVIQELVAMGTRIVSLNPLRGTLEDFFVEQVRAADDNRIGRAS